jgi:hypothetical protein
MKNEDLERLKKLLKGTEFEIKAGDNVFACITVKDHWEGVEFVECTTDPRYNFKRGKVYRLVPGANIGRGNCIYTEDGETGSCLGIGGTKKNFNPSTEEAYVDQLKAKAFELFGEIKDGDRFDRSSMGFVVKQGNDEVKNLEPFFYFKDHDQLWKGGLCIYNKGQWAKKLPKRIEVLGLGITFGPNEAAYDKAMSIGKEAINDYMTKQLEKLLNDEVE